VALRLPRGANEARYTKVPIGKLRFDPENPRLGGEATRKNQEQIQKYLEGPPHYALELVGSMVENGFLPYEPLVVRQAGDEFVVIEGNRRLAAVLSILSTTKYPPAVRLSRNIALLRGGQSRKPNRCFTPRYLSTSSL